MVVAKIIKNLVPGSIIQEIENKEEFRPKRGTLSCEKIKQEIGHHSKIDLEESLPNYKKYLNDE